VVVKRSRGFSPWSFPAAVLPARRLSWLASVHVCAFATYPILYWSGTLHGACKWPSLSWLGHSRKQVVFWDAGGSTRVSTLVRPEYGRTQPESSGFLA
jgi:hypothetical protein